MAAIDVTCAIISIDEKILVVQRSAIMSQPLKWEFPGGKIEEGESEVECIKREIKEELNIDIEVLEKLTPSTFDYATVTIRLIPFTCEFKSGQIRLSEHAQFLILEKQRLDALDWAEADVSILNEFLNL